MPPGFWRLLGEGSLIAFCSADGKLLWRYQTLFNYFETLLARVKAREYKA